MPFVWGMAANYIYFRHAEGRVQNLGPQPDCDEAVAAGGTSTAAVLVAMGINLVIFVALVVPIMNKSAEARQEYVSAAERMQEQASNTAEGRKTAMVLQTTALMTTLWLTNGQELHDVSLEAVATGVQQSVEKFNDGWGNPVRIVPSETNFEVRSAGPDGRFDSEDDIVFAPPSRR
jgi:hypothetical protein